MAAGCNASANPRHCEICRRKLDEVEHGPETKLRPSTDPGKIVSRRQAGLDGEGCDRTLGSVQPGDELAGRGSIGGESYGFELDLIRVQEGYAGMKQWNELSREGGLAGTVDPR